MNKEWSAFSASLVSRSGIQTLQENIKIKVSRINVDDVEDLSSLSCKGDIWGKASIEELNKGEIGSHQWEGTEGCENDWLNTAWEFCVEGGVTVEHSGEKLKVQFICSETRNPEDAVEQTWYEKSPGKEMTEQEVNRNNIQQVSVVSILPVL